jgi:signal transduction histidine kinase
VLLQQNAQQLQETEKACQSNYQILTSGLLHYKQQLEQLHADIEKIQDELKSQAFKAEVYAHAPILCEKLKQFASFQQELSLIDGKIKVTTASIGQFGDALEKKKAEIAQQQGIVTNLSQDAEVLKSQAQQFDLADLTRQQTEKTNLLNQLKNVQKSVQDLRKQQDEITTLKNAVNAQQQQVQELNQQFGHAQQQFVAAQAAQVTAQKCYDSAAQSVNDFAKQIRAGLQVGDTCPVCGQKVEQLLTNEAVEQSVKALQQQLAEANKAVDDSKKALNTVTTNLSRAQGSFDAAQKDLQLKSQQQKSALSALGEVCQTLNITMDKTIDEQLDNLIAATKEEAQVITQRIENAIQLNKQLTEKSEQLSKQNKQLEIALSRAEESDRMKDSFIEHVSHEIRTPLNIITGYAQIITNPEYELDDEERNRMLNDINKNTSKITYIVNELLEIAEDDSKQHYPKNDLIAVNEFCRKIMDYAERINSGRLKMLFNSELTDDFSFYSNRHVLEKVIEQLLNNAIKFTHTGFVELKVHESPDHGVVRFIVTDSGIGIAEENQEHVFDRFFKEDPFKQGFGLGLTMCRKMAILLGGSLFLDKEYKAGARFILTLPKVNDQTLSS